MPFVCVTGLTTPAEAALLASVPRPAGVGFVGAILQTAGAESPQRPRQAVRDAIPAITAALHAQGAATALHLAGRDGDLVRGHLAALDAAGARFDWLQLNSNPHHAHLIAPTMALPLILALPARAHAWRVERLAPLRLAGALIVDPSGGRGRAIVDDVLGRAALGLAAVGWTGEVIVAGGLEPDNVAAVIVRASRILGRPVSVDAESRLRRSDDSLDIDRARAYVEAAAIALASPERAD
jgi:phosphoribosylanthranilate isomerase